MNKQIKTILVLAGLLLWAALPLAAQEYTVELSKGTLTLSNLNKISVQGHSGSSIVFKTRNQRTEESERAKGLKAINSMGLVDNSGIGLSVVKTGTNVKVQQVSRRYDGEYTILVPKGVALAINHDTHNGDKIKVKDVSSEININTKHNGMLLANVTGPLTISTVHGDVDVIFGGLNQQAPVSIIATHGHIDVSMPSAAKANLQLTTQHGDVYSDMPIDIAPQASTEELSRRTPNDIIGKLNGGGVAVNLDARYGNIYLRNGK